MFFFLFPHFLDSSLAHFSTLRSNNIVNFICSKFNDITQVQISVFIGVLIYFFSNYFLIDFTCFSSGSAIKTVWFFYCKGRSGPCYELGKRFILIESTQGTQKISEKLRRENLHHLKVYHQHLLKGGITFTVQQLLSQTP